MKHRIEYLIGELKMTNAKFAEEIGVPKSIISHILTGRNKPSLEFITKILNRFTNINSDWLLFGKGNIFSTDKANEKNNNLNLFDNITKTNEQTQELYTETTINKQNNIENKTSLTKQIAKIIVYYTDNTYEEFYKSN